MRPSALKIDVLTLFPGLFEGPFAESLVKRAQDKGLISIRVHSLRQWSDDKRHLKVDDRPFGGGAGMVFRPEPLYRALKALGGMKKKNKAWVIYLSPQGKVLNQEKAQLLAKKRHIILICGHYEGIDERIFEWIDEEVSIGDYVLTGGEIPAMVLIDAVVRLVPGVVKEPGSIANDSFSNGLLDYPQYTRPSRWRKRDVPDELLSGDHKRIDAWRQKMMLQQTKAKRPDILRG